MTGQLTLSTFEFKAMGSPCQLKLYADNVANAANAIHAAATEIQRLEDKYSRYKKDNYLYKVNQAAQHGSSITIDEEFSSILDFADACYQQSDGLFDITSGVLRQAWDFQSGKIPGQELINNLKTFVGWQYVKREPGKITFLKPGMELDFGGIIKEYAVDRAATACREHGIRFGLVDLGGDMHCIGPHPDGRPWVIDIRHPRDNSKPLATVAITTGALASSGDYERCITINKERYCHVLSPKTGWPVRGIAGVAVVAEQCVLAGSICTIAMLKEFNGIGYMNELGVDYVAMDVEGKQYQSSQIQHCKMVIS